MLFYLPVLLVLILCALYIYFTRTFNYWKKRNVAGPPPVAFFGNIKESSLRRTNIGIQNEEFYNAFPNERVVGIYRMTSPALLIRDLDIIKHIMIKDFDVFRDRGVEFSKHGLGQNLFHSDGSTWGALRARFSPIFTSGKLKGMFHLLYDCANQLITHLDDMGPQTTGYDISSLAQKYTMSSISACAFGVNLNNFEKEVDGTLKDLDKMVFTTNFAFELDMMYPGLLKKLDISLFPAKVNQFFEGLVRDIILQRNGRPAGRGDFMDLILQLREMGEITSLKIKEGEDPEVTKITEDVIAAQAFIFYVAGFETSSTTISFLLYLLALHPEIQAKLREEIDSVTEAYGLARGEITYESLKDMKYLEKSFLETLRLYPIVDLMRKANADYKIPGTDVTIKKDLTVLVSVLGIHYDKNYYPNPEVFDPNRFDPEVVGSRHSCAYLPFGVGPRNCIGMRFGSLQTRLCVAKLLSRFQVEPNEYTKTPITINPKRVILSPKEHIYLNIKPRAF